MTLNHAIRLLELIADVYARVLMGGKPNVWHADDVAANQWSLAARKAIRENPKAAYGTFLRVEHGTPRREFALKILALYEKGRLTPRAMRVIVNKYWRVAVLTHEEDRRIRRKPLFKMPQERWAHYGIKFPKGSPNAI